MMIPAGDCAFGRVIETPARLATGFFADTPFSGQVNLLTTSSFDTPRRLFSGSNTARAPPTCGSGRRWAIRATGWCAACSARRISRRGCWPARLRTRAGPPSYEFGMSYAQRYDGGNQLALRDVSDGSRNAGMVYAADAFTIAPALTVSYGGRYAQYDYLEHRTLISPRVALTVSPTDRFRVTTVVSRQTHGARGRGIPAALRYGDLAATTAHVLVARTGEMLDASRTMHVSVAVERDIAMSTLSVGAFRQRVDDQLVTLFGVDVPAQPGAKLAIT